MRIPLRLRILLISAVLLLTASPGLAADGSEEFEGDEPGECHDGADNDRDGLFDCADDGCAGAPDCEGD